MTSAFQFEMQIMGGCLLLTAMTVMSRAQPVNDHFANRIHLSEPTLQVESSNTGATTEPAEPMAVTELGGASVWWEWTAPVAGRVTVTTAGSGFDTILGVFVGDTMGALSLIASNDDEDLLGGIFTSRLTFVARQGTSYQIVVAGLGSEPGGFANGDIRWQLAPVEIEPLPAWDITTLDGEEIDSSSLPGEIVLVDFWATWCVPCRAEMPAFIDLVNRYSSAGLAVLGVSVDTDAVTVVREFADELGVNFPLAMTTASLEQALGGVPAIPTAFVLDSDNNLIARHVGFREHEFWEAEMQALLDTGIAPVTLQGALSGDQIELSWPATTSDWTLQIAANLGGPWSVVSEAPQTGNGQAVVALSVTNAPDGFFRLAQP